MSEAEINTDKPELDDKTIERMERGASSQGIGQIRRVCLLTMGKSLEDLNQCSKDDPELFGELMRASTEFRDHAKALLEVAESSVLRLSLADEHGDISAALDACLAPKEASNV